MRRLSKVVNIVPVIAKADTLTLEERDYFKQTVRGVCESVIVDLCVFTRVREYRVNSFFLHVTVVNLSYIWLHCRATTPAITCSR